MRGLPGAAELLDDLRAHRVRLATATSKGVEPTRRMLDHFDLTRRFDVIAAATMDATAHHKIDVVRAALADLSPYDPDRTVLVGDRSFDIDAGHDMGIATVGVTWGYGSPRRAPGPRARPRRGHVRRPPCPRARDGALSWGRIREEG